MSHLDASVAALLDRAPINNASEDEDALIDELEDDGSFVAFREQRVQQLHAELTKARQLQDSGHGRYTQIRDEKTLMDITVSTKLCLAHFFKPDFNRCRIMDSHLEALSAKHIDTRFVSMNVENAPFLVTKLKVQVLPCVLAFVNGVAVDRIVGFEGLGGNGDSFSTRELESRLLHSGVLTRPKITDNGDAYVQQANIARDVSLNNDVDDDWD